MIKISHRGNVNGRDWFLENSPDYIDATIKAGYDVEVDVRLWNNTICLGHDEPQWPIPSRWLIKRKNNLWIHVKDIHTTQILLNYNLRLFFHEKERHTLITNSKFVWTHDLSEAQPNSIIPLLANSDIQYLPKYRHVAGICTDFPCLI